MDDRAFWEVPGEVMAAVYQDGMSTYDLAIYLDRSPMGVQDRLRRYGITQFRGNKTPPVMTGEDNPRWRGGKSRGYRDARRGNWWAQKKLALERDEYTCRDCGATEKLVVHHDGDQTDHALEGLRTLCKSCHIKLHAPHEARWGSKGR